MANEDWHAIARRVQASLHAKIPEAWILKVPVPESRLNVMGVARESGILSEEELALTEKDASELLSLLANGSVKSYDLTMAFCKRAAIAQQLLNCISVILFDEALDRARELDHILETTGKVVGPYHGLPVSIKDHYNISGTANAAGYVAWADDISKSDALTVSILRNAGAVFHCKTTVPQTLMHLECNSNLFGRTLNPFNRALSSGGSSGGEAALIGFYGSPIGVGSDGGGSIRAPAGNTALIGMKQTSGRIPNEGMRISMTGSTATPVVTNVLARSVRDTRFFMKTIIDTEPWLVDPAMLALPWKPAKLPEKLKIGYFFDDGVVRPHPPVVKALEGIVELLSKDPSVEIKPFEPYEHAWGYDIIRRLYFQDGGADNYRVMEQTGEPALPLSQWIFKPSHTKRRTIEESWALNSERQKFQMDYLKNFNAADVHVILCPYSGGVAPAHDTARYWGYTAVFNNLDWPACTFPTGQVVSASAHPVDSAYIPRENEFDAYNWSQYSPQRYKDAPISLQLVGRRFQCELVLDAVEHILSIIQKASAQP